MISQLLIASGFLFMGATEEQMALLSSKHVTHVSYILLIFSISFLLFLCRSSLIPVIRARSTDKFTVVNMLIHLYAVHAFPESAQRESGDAVRPRRRADEEAADAAPYANGHANGHANGYAKHAQPLPERERRRMRDAQEFELDSLISDEEDEQPVKEGKHNGSVRL